jgi:hypothetical protein
VKKAKKSEKKQKNILEFRFASMQELLNRSEAKNFKRKKVKNAKKMRKIAKKVKKSEKIDLKFASL